LGSSIAPSDRGSRHRAIPDDILDDEEVVKKRKIKER
jgi:hypothetical protein